LNAQAKDVVAGTRTPNPISQLKRNCRKSTSSSMPSLSYSEALRRHAGREFTIERGKLWMLQTRTGNAPRGLCAHRG